MREYKEFFRNHPVFTLKEYFQAIPRNHKTAYSNLMKNYIQKGKVKSMRRGLLAVVPLGTAPLEYTPDKIHIASRLTEDAVLAYHTALEVLGYSHSISFRYYYLTCQQKSKIIIDGSQYISVNSSVDIEKGNLAQGFIGLKYHDLDVTLTDRERTFVDCINRPEYAGGIEEVYKSIENYPFLDLDKVLKYLGMLRSKVLYARVGFFLEQHREQFFIENEFLDRLRSSIPSSVVYFTRKRDSGKLIRRWNLIVPERIIEEKWTEFPK